jgi:enamine deaminase RidA (YjgF/YER057c/UK114 family)
MSSGRVSGGVTARLKAKGLELPPAPPPVATYVGFVTVGKLVHVAGVGPTWGKEIRHAGKVGGGLSLEDGYAAAQLTALNLLAHMKAACDGDLDRIARCVKVLALVNAGPDFTDAHRVADGVTDLFADLFGADRLPARAATTAPSLPFDIAFEADAVFLLH